MRFSEWTWTGLCHSPGVFFLVQVWDVLQEVAVANYRGHMGYLLCVDWSPVDPDLVWTGGKDFTVQEWNVSEQEFSKPPKGGDTEQVVS